ncbi:MAG TPA: carboxypeptidase-like regulatory domain-containing protein [Puia sp.]|nr:carboxypeptidase-like regulatory domain-containing protein [Puia sp.]
MRKIRETLTLFTVLLWSSGLCAQQRGEISGTVRSSDKKPIEAATVSLLRSKDSSLVKISVSNQAGAYEFNRLRSGPYFFQWEFQQPV